ncbi:MAG: hypothetical protein AAGN46_11490 [Acidobacteriota bacterium]
MLRTATLPLVPDLTPSRLAGSPAGAALDRPAGGRWLENARRAIADSRRSVGRRLLLERVERQARRPGAVVELGTTERPFETLVGGEAALRLLRDRPGRALRLVCRRAPAAAAVSLLAELDTDHQVTIEMVCTARPSDAGKPSTVADIERLAAQGLGVVARLDVADEPSPGDLAALEDVAVAALEAGAVDLRLPADAALAAQRLVRRLALQFALPRRLAGRG